MKNGLQKTISRLNDRFLRPFFMSIKFKVRNFIKEKIFGNIVREMIIELTVASQNQNIQKPLSREDFKNLLPKPKYGVKINVIKSYLEWQDEAYGQTSEKSFMDKVKTMTTKEVEELFDSLEEMNKSINERKDFCFLKVEKKTNDDALNLQKELDERGFIIIEEETDKIKDK